MIHRLALLMGGAGAAGVLAVALTLNGSAPPSDPGAFVPVANDVMGADQLALALTTDLSGQVEDPDQPAPATDKQVDTIYVLPPTKDGTVHTNKPTGARDNQPSDTPQPGGNGGGNGDGGNGGGDVAGDDDQDDDADDDQGDDADEDEDEDHDDEEDEHDGGDDSDDGGHEPGDD